MKKDGKETLISMILVLVVLGVGVMLAFYKQGLIDFADAGTRMGILIGAAVIVALIGVCAGILYVRIRFYDPEKVMKKLQKKRAMSLKGICYYMYMPQIHKIRSHMYATILAIGIWLFAFQLFPSMRYWSSQQVYGAMIFGAVLVNTIVALVIRELECKKLVEDAEWRLNMPKDLILEKLNTSLKKGLLFKKRHLVITEEFLIFQRQAIPIAYLETCGLRELNTAYERFHGLYNVNKLELNGRLKNGKSFSAPLGCEDEELAHIKRFLEYFKSVNEEFGRTYRM